MSGPKTPEYAAWVNMRGRCRCTTNAQYFLYGARGITVCSRWSEPNGAGFKNFYADLGPRPSPKHSLDRIDVNGNYEPANCRWATIDQQNRNKRVNRFVRVNGEDICATDLARRYSLPTSTVFNRLRKGKPVEKVIAPTVKLHAASREVVSAIRASREPRPALCAKYRLTYSQVRRIQAMKELP